MSTWFTFALLSVVVLAGSEISQKISLTQKVDISAITNNFFVWIIQGTVGLVLAFALGQFTLNIPIESWYKVLAIGFIYFLGGTSFYTSYKGNSPSISILLGTISVVVSSILGYIFLSDTFTTAKILGVLLILSAIFVINYDRKQKFNKYNLYALLGGICFGVAFTIDKSMVTTLSPFMYLTLMCYAVAIVSAIIGFKIIISDTKRMISRNFLPIISSGSFGSTFNLFTFYAYRNGGSVGVVDAMNNTSIFLVILLEMVLLKDFSNTKRKLVAASLAILGIVMIGTLG